MSMNFDLSEVLRAISATARRFVENELPGPTVLQWVRERVEPPRALFKRLGDLGMYSAVRLPDGSFVINGSGSKLCTTQAKSADFLVFRSWTRILTRALSRSAAYPCFWWRTRVQTLQ